jgi:hypothetical protein
MPEILLFEGLKRGGKKSMAGRGNCTRKKKVYSPYFGKTVLRCASYSGTGGGLGQLGALPIDMEQLKGIGLTTGIGVGAAVLARKFAVYPAEWLKIDPVSNWNKVLEVLVGLLAGIAVGKYAKQPDIGMAVAIGPAMINGMELAGEILSPNQASIAGYRRNPALGAIVERDRFPAAWTQPTPYMQSAQQQYPAWAL